MASNEHGLRSLKKVDHCSAKKKKKKIARSMHNVIRMCNRNTGGVDRLNENISLPHCNSRKNMVLSNILLAFS